MNRRPAAYATVQIEGTEFRIPVFAHNVVETVEVLALWRYARSIFGRSAMLTQAKVDSWAEDRSALYWSAQVYTREGLYPLFWVDRSEVKERNRESIEAAIKRAKQKEAR